MKYSHIYSFFGNRDPLSAAKAVGIIITWG